MSTIFARKALLAKGWAENVRLDVAAGCVSRIDTGASPDAMDDRADIVIPGLCNAHSHAFQRALVGHTEQRSPVAQRSQRFTSIANARFIISAQDGPSDQPSGVGPRTGLAGLPRTARRRHRWRGAETPW